LFEIPAEPKGIASERSGEAFQGQMEKLWPVMFLYGCGLSYEVLGALFGVSKPMIHNSVSSRKAAARQLGEEHILAYWRNLTAGLTGNASERFNRKIEKCVWVRYGLKTQESAQVLLTALWFKELLLHEKKHLDTLHSLHTLNLARIRQQHFQVHQILHFFNQSTAADTDIAA